jgi:two-component system, sensor histidine kinase PdtaS
MEKLLNWLPAKPQPLLVRYGVSTAMVAICFGLMRFVEVESGISSFFLFYPAIFLSALLFDRGSGFYAAGLITVLLMLLIHEQKGAFAFVASYWLPLTLFLLVGLATAALTELLRKGWERAVTAEQIKDLLYRELAHRTKNDFAMAASVLSAFLSSTSPATSSASLIRPSIPGQSTPSRLLAKSFEHLLQPRNLVFGFTQMLA